MSLDPQIPAAVVVLVRAYRSLLDQRFGGRLQVVRVFGSYARGDADTDSDIDVAVIVTDLTEQERTCAVDLAFEAWRLDPSAAPLSPLVWSKAELDDRVRAQRRIVDDIFAEGISF